MIDNNHDNNDDNNDDNNNVFFSIEDKYNIEDNLSEITDINCDTPSILNISTDGYLYSHLCGAPDDNEMNGNACDDLFGLSYYKKKSLYGEDCYSYYDREYTVKELMKICEYYNIDKDIKSLKSKKNDIISSIIIFESLAENQSIVYKRNQMWAYIEALRNDSGMRKYIIWN